MILCKNLLDGFIKWGRIKQAVENMQKSVNFKLLVLSYMYTTLYFSFLYFNYMNKIFDKKKFKSTNMDLTHL